MNIIVCMTHEMPDQSNKETMKQKLQEVQKLMSIINVHPKIDLTIVYIIHITIYYTSYIK